MADDEEEGVVLGGFIVLAAIADRLREQERQRLLRKQRSAVRGYVRLRGYYGAFHSLVQELKDEDAKKYKNFLRMSPETFDKLLQLVRPLIQKEETNFKKPIAPEERLAVTLRYLASGMSFLIIKYIL